MLRRLAFLASFLLAIPAVSQVQLGGHVYVPSSTDSTNGLTRLSLFGATTCNLLNPVVCTLENSNGDSPGPDAPYVGTLQIVENSGVVTNILLPYTPGRFYTVIDNSFLPASAQAWDVATSSPTGDIISIPANSTTLLWATFNSSGDPSYESIGGGSGIVNGTPNIALNFPQKSSFTIGPAMTDPYWGENAAPVIFIGSPCQSQTPPWDNDYEPTMECDAVNVNAPVGNAEGNFGTGNQSEVSNIIFNDNAVDGGYTSFLAYGTHGTNFTVGGNNEPANLGAPLVHFLTGIGGPLYIGTNNSDNGVDSPICMAYNFNPTCDVTINSTGVHMPSLEWSCTSGQCYKSDGNGTIEEQGSVTLTANSSAENSVIITLPFSLPNGVYSSTLTSGGIPDPGGDASTPIALQWENVWPGSGGASSNTAIAAKVIVAGAGGGTFVDNITVYYTVLGH